MSDKLITIPKSVLMDFHNHEATENDLAIIHKVVNHNSSILHA